MKGIISAFGYHDRSSPRHWSVCEQLKSEGWTIIECHTSAKGFLAKCRDLIRQWKEQKKNVNAILVPFPGHYLMPLAWLITRIPRKRLIVDAL